MVSEARRRSAPAIEWLRAVDPASLFLSVITIGEIAKGIAIRERTDPVAAAALGRWIDGLRRLYGDRILPVDEAIATAWGQMTARRAFPVLDGLIAATARVHNLILVTRNVADFGDSGIELTNPWAR